MLLNAIIPVKGILRVIVVLAPLVCYLVPFRCDESVLHLVRNFDKAIGGIKSGIIVP